MGRSHWGRGYATEAARLVVTHAFSDLQLVSLVAVIDLDIEVESFIGLADEWIEKHHSRLVHGLQSLDRELSIAKDALDL